MINKIVFTTATPDRIPHAISLSKSIEKYCSGYKVIIGVVDKRRDEILKYETENIEFVFADDFQVDDFEYMVTNYNSFEIATAYKSIFGNFFIDKYPNFEYLIYIDSDILLFNSFELIEKEMGENEIMFAPHYFSDPNDDNKLTNQDILLAGLYNSGFVIIKNTDEAKSFYKWWQKKCTKEGYNQPAKGMFVDQLWFNFVPLFFNNVKLTKHLGINVGYWNLHEREITKSNESYMVNNKFPLIFYHFSAYKLERPDLLSIHQNRFELSNEPVLSEIFNQYKSNIEVFDIKYFNGLRSKLIDNSSEIKKRNSFSKKVKTFIRKRIK